MEFADLERIKIMIVDDHVALRASLRETLEQQDGYTIVAEAGRVSEAVELALASHPDVLLLDLHLEDGSGFDVWRRVARCLPRTKLVFLTADGDFELQRAARDLGAAAYLLKPARARDLVSVIDDVTRTLAPSQAPRCEGQRQKDLK